MLGKVFVAQILCSLRYLPIFQDGIAFCARCINSVLRSNGGADSFAGVDQRFFGQLFCGFESVVVVYAEFFYFCRNRLAALVDRRACVGYFCLAVGYALAEFGYLSFETAYVSFGFVEIAACG